MTTTLKRTLAAFVLLAGLASLGLYWGTRVAAEQPCRHHTCPSTTTTTTSTRPSTTTTSTRPTTTTTSTSTSTTTTSTSTSTTTTSTSTSTTTTTTLPPPPSGPITALHYTANGNFDSNGNYLPGADGFNLADITSNGEATSLPSGVKGLVWIGLCNGADANFTSTISPFIGDTKVFGFYLMDEPDPSSCPAANLKAESDWVHANDPGTITFIIEEDLSSSNHPTYQGGYNPANSDIDLYGLDPYPCRTELGDACDYSWLGLAVTAAEQAGIPLADIVPVYQAFGGGTWVDDGGGQYLMPTPAEESEILTTWGQVVPAPAFDYAYSWGVQDADTALTDSPGDQAVLLAHNTAAS